MGGYPVPVVTWCTRGDQHTLARRSCLRYGQWQKETEKYKLLWCCGDALRSKDSVLLLKLLLLWPVMVAEAADMCSIREVNGTFERL